MKAFWSSAHAHLLMLTNYQDKFLLPKFSHQKRLSNRILLCLHNLVNRHGEGFHLPLIPASQPSPVLPSALFNPLFNYLRAALISSGHSFLPELHCCPPLQHPHVEKSSWKSIIPDEQRIFESCGEPAFGLLRGSSFSPVKSRHHLFTAALFI